MYESDEGAVSIDVVIDKDWKQCGSLKKTMVELFNVNRSVITKHLKNIYDDGELSISTSCAKIAHVQKEGNCEVKKHHFTFTKYYFFSLDDYILDCIINSYG